MLEDDDVESVDGEGMRVDEASLEEVEVDEVLKDNAETRYCTGWVAST